MRRVRNHCLRFKFQNWTFCLEFLFSMAKYWGSIDNIISIFWKQVDILNRYWCAKHLFHISKMRVSNCYSLFSILKYRKKMFQFNQQYLLLKFHLLLNIVFPLNSFFSMKGERTSPKVISSKLTFVTFTGKKKDENEKFNCYLSGYCCGYYARQVLD